MLAASTTVHDVQQESQSVVTEGPLCPQCHAAALVQVSPVRPSQLCSPTSTNIAGHMGMSSMHSTRRRPRQATATDRTTPRKD